MTTFKRKPSTYTNGYTTWLPDQWKATGGSQQTSYRVLELLDHVLYLLVLFRCTSIMVLVTGRLASVTSDRKSFRTRINLAMSSVSFISLISIGVLTVVYVIRE